MRKVCVVAAVLLLPAFAYGELATTVDVNILAGTHAAVAGGTGAASIELLPGASGTLELWTTLELDGDIGGLQYSIQCNGGACDGLFTYLAPEPAGASFVPGKGNVFDYTFGSQPALFGVGDHSQGHAAGQTLLNDSGSGELISHGAVGDGNFHDEAVAPIRTLVGVSLQYTNLPQGNYVFTLGPVGQLPGSVASVGGVDLPVGGDAFTLIVPEPASAMLLLLALPFLRRRR